jgi:hypothetical protein
VGRHESLGLGGNRSEHAFLVEANAIGAASIGGAFKARAANLPATAIATGNCGALPRGSSLVDYLRWRLGVHVGPWIWARRRRRETIVRILGALYGRMDGGHAGWRRRMLRIA